MLLTKEIEEKLQSQYPHGSNFEAQEVVCKLFIGSHTWYLLNQDPEDLDYLWCIVRNDDIIECGSVLKSDLTSIYILGVLGVERDKFFKPINAKELWDRLIEGEHI